MKSITRISIGVFIFIALVAITWTISNNGLQAQPLDEFHPSNETTEVDESVQVDIIKSSGIEVEEALLQRINADHAAGYMIYFGEEADLSPAYAMNWEDRGEFVVEALQTTAEKTQTAVRAHLDAQGADYQSFWIDNIIVVESSSIQTFNSLMNFSEIKSLKTQRTMQVIEPIQTANTPSSIFAIEPNISHVQTPAVWALGYSGAGMVVANIDTGVRYTHEVLDAHYRGNLGTGSYDHDYNWLDPDSGNITPVDDHGHGSHTMGTMIGDDNGTNQVGMAPDATWIACDACNASTGCPETALLTCAQWVTAPYPIGDPGSADPNMRPHVVNNSWGDCGTTYDNWYEGSITAWHAIGIYPVFSNGNSSNCGYSSPPGLNTVGNPARSGNVTGVGSTGQSNGLYATHSNWGPTDNLDTVNPKSGYANLKPQVMAPGVGIRSSLNGSDSNYQSWTGTSMSAPHVTALVALMWQAAPCLVGNYADTETILEDTAIGIPYDDGSGGGATVPNQATGWGEINALAAVEAAQASCGPQGILQGSVTNSSTAAPIPQANIVATFTLTDTYSTQTDINGLYSTVVASGTYTVSAAAYGYLSTEITAVSILSGTTTTQDIALTPTQSYTVDGCITDATTGWPLYASIDILPDGYSVRTIWNDPVTGCYTVIIPSAYDHTFTVNAWVDGYETAVRAVNISSNQTEDFALNADLTGCTAPGYTGTPCAPQAGGLVVGNVYDNNTMLSIDGATVANNSGESTTTATTADPLVDDGFYTIFSIAGTANFTATMTTYSDESLSATVVQSDTVASDFYLKSSYPVVSPTSLHATVGMGFTTTLPLTISNSGDGSLYFEFAEKNGGVIITTLTSDASPIPNQTEKHTPPIMRLSDGSVDCAAYKNYIGFEPQEIATQCGISAPNPIYNNNILAPTDMGYAQDIGFISDNFISFALNNFSGQTAVGTNTDAYYGMDFDLAATTLYALNDTTDQLGTIDLATGAFTGLVPSVSPSGNWTGLTIDPSSDTFYASDATSLYTIDPATGTPTLVGAFGNGISLMIDIAMNSDGEMYGHAIDTDSIYQIDPTTGAATLVGVTGFDGNFAQGMDFDNDDGTLYIFLYIGGGANVYGTVDLTTGAVTALATDNPQGEFEGAIQIAGSSDVPWLAESLISGTVPSLTDTVIDVYFDAGVPEVGQPGDYYATLLMNNNSPISPINVPVTMTVTPLPSTGKLDGTVTVLGHCDVNPAAPADGAEVFVEYSNGMSVTLTTDASGNYGPWWIDESASPLTITVDYLGYEQGYASGVAISSGMTTTQTFLNLRWLEPCVNTDMDSMEVYLLSSTSTRITLDINNAGAVSTTFALSENVGGFTLTAPLAGEDILVVAEYDATIVNNALTALGYTYLEVNNTTYSGMSMDDLLTYKAVIYLGTVTTGNSEETQTLAYLDAGGSFLHADNDHGYFYSDDPLYSTYYQASYGTDGGSSGVLTGLDIMAGINPDISADPYPDDFTIIGADAVAIFEAPSTDLAGLRIARNDYKAIYLAWDYSNTNNASQIPVIDNALNWLISSGDIPWLSEDPITGTISAGGLVSIDVTFDTMTYTLGVYTGILQVKSNDPVNRTIAIPVTMHIVAELPTYKIYLPVILKW